MSLLKKLKFNRLLKQKNIKDLYGFLNGNIDDDDICNLIEAKLDITIEEFNLIFTEDGNINYDFSDQRRLDTIIFNPKIKRIMMAVDMNWDQHFTAIQKQYIRFTLDHPNYDLIVSRIEHHDVEDHIQMCFSSDGFTDFFYQEAFIKYLVETKKLLQDSHFLEQCSDLEKKLLHKSEDELDMYSMFATYYLDTKTPIRREDLKDYFDGKKFTDLFYKRMLLNPDVNGYIADNPRKYEKYYSKLELAFTEKFNFDSKITNLLDSDGKAREKISEYFYYDGKLHLTSAGIKRFFDERLWYVLLELDTPLNIIRSKDIELSTAEIKLYELYTKIPNDANRFSFINLITEYQSIFELNEEGIDKFLDIFDKLTKKIELSNAPELINFEGHIILQLMSNDNPDQALDIMDSVFSRNNLPSVGKAFLVYKILHPNYNGFDLEVGSKSSPVLCSTKSDEKKDIIIFSDLIKCAVGSNNRELRDYLINIQKGNEIYLRVKDSLDSVVSLPDNEKRILKTFVSHLNVLYNNTKEGKQKPRVNTGNLNKDLEELVLLFNPTHVHDLPDRIVRSFSFFAGYKSFDEIWTEFVNAREKAYDKNVLAANSLGDNSLELNVGDFIKGIGGVKYLEAILQRGSLAKEHLGKSATSDCTELDTDLSRITSSERRLSDTVENTIAAAYGPIWFVIKNDDRLSITRDGPKSSHPYDSNKLEAFMISPPGHYGIRTGFPSSDIDYIIVDSSLVQSDILKIKHIITLNGFYIPVIDLKSGKLIFTPEEYELMRKKLSGLTQYDSQTFNFSTTLNAIGKTDEIITQNQKNNEDANKKRSCINGVIQEVLKDFGIELKTEFDFDISTGNAQLIDTGSTGRGTSVGSNDDFDFVLRLDSGVDQEKLREKLVVALKGTDNGGAKLAQGARVDGIDTPIDIDISLVKKAKTNYYTTDSALKDRLKQIKTQDEKKYQMVIANIYYAKKCLKEAMAYKPSHSRDNNDGGLGGVGVENWILQYGGSFYDAAKDFVKNAENKSFSEFMKTYQIWDYGRNYYTGDYDEFVSGNMTERGYIRMVRALKKALKKMDTYTETQAIQNSKELSPKLSVEVLSHPTINQNDQPGPKL